jgi:hypothetical protein
MKRDSVLAQRLAWFRSGLILAAMLGLGIVGLNDAAFARAGETLNAAPRAAVPDGAIVVADKDWKGGKNKGSNWNKNKNKNKNWSGNKNWHPNYNKHNQHWGKGWSNYNNNWNKNWNRRAYVRNWNRRPYYGQFVGGIMLGSLLTATAVGVVPYAPQPYLCWYWADPFMYRGYWDYCY